MLSYLLKEGRNLCLRMVRKVILALPLWMKGTYFMGQTAWIHVEGYVPTISISVKVERMLQYMVKDLILQEMLAIVTIMSEPQSLVTDTIHVQS